MENLEFVDFVKVDIPSKSFSIIGSNGTIQKLKCKNSKEFMSKFKFLKENIDENIVSFIDLD
tara:strand:+ start:254 stop:439 length:186 start_codon:yes stop_codon:yes gene_type:complete